MQNLAANTRPNDESFAEFFSIFVPAYMNCHELLNRLEEVKGEGKEVRHMQMKKRARDSETFFFNIVDLYGCRPSDESLLYLSPFEFIMWWDVCSLEAPPFPEDAAERARKRLPVYKLTRWCVPAAELAVLRCDPGFKPVPGSITRSIPSSSRTNGMCPTVRDTGRTLPMTASQVSAASAANSSCGVVFAKFFPRHRDRCLTAE